MQVDSFNYLGTTKNGTFTENKGHRIKCERMKFTETNEILSKKKILIRLKRTFD